MQNKLITFILSLVMISTSVTVLIYSIYKSNNIEKMVTTDIKIPIIGMNTLKKEMEKTNNQLEYMVQEVEKRNVEVADYPETRGVSERPEICNISEVSESEIEYISEVREECSDPYCYKCLYNNWDDELKEYTRELCKESGVPYEYVLGVIWLESRFDENARSSYGGYSNYGLMQINGINYEYLKDKVGLKNVEDLMDEKMNIKSGIALLKEHLDYTGDYDDMILRYQVGGGSYEKYKREGRTVKFVGMVSEKAEQFKEII